jgi:hypothetical protein
LNIESGNLGTEIVATIPIPQATLNEDEFDAQMVRKVV